MNKFALNIPLNSVSFGQVSIAICREIYRRGLAPCIFPIGNVDLSAQKPDADFQLWLQSCVNKSHKTHNRNDTSVKLWHLSDLLASYSKEQIGITFLETDQVTDHELNVINNQKVMFVTSNYTKQVMEEVSAQNVKYLELGFDKDNFYDTKKSYLNPDTIVFSLFGKAEPQRKRTLKIIQNWVKKYGNQREYVLHAAVYNVFLKPEDNQALLNQAFGGVRYWNVNVLPYVQTNVEYNEIVNSAGIVLALSGGEGRDLPVFHSVGLGRHCLALRAHSYLDYLNDENSVFISASSKIKAADGMFFHENSNFSAGNFFDWNDSDFGDACDLVVKRYKSNRINSSGLLLQNRTYKDTVDQLINGLE